MPTDPIAPAGQPIAAPTAATPAPVHPRTPLARTIVIALAAAALVALALLAFSWPSVTAEPRALPVGIAGDDAQVAQVTDALAARSDGAIELVRVDDRAAAIDAIEHRELYGAIVLGSTPTEAPEVLTASAANTQVAQLLQGVATTMQTQIDAQVRATVEAGVREQLAAIGAGAVPPQAAAAAADQFAIPTVTVTVTDVVPLAASDPRGAGLAAAAFPLVLGGMIGAGALSFAVHGSRRRLVGLAIYAPVAGLVLTGVLEGMYGALQGNFWLNAAAFAAAVAAISAPILGLRTLIGTAGMGIGAAFMMLVANPISAATVPVEFLAAPWGAIGQWLPPGAAATLVRTLSYFPAADTSFPWLVLAAWIAGGLALMALGSVRGRRATAAPAPAPAPA